jgi:hypothetical protein
MPVGQCKLCLLENQELQDSHLMPQGMYKRVRSEDQDNPHPILIDKTGSRSCSDQITDYVFCKACEARFDRNGESYALRMAALRGRFRLQEELQIVQPSFEELDFRGYSVKDSPQIKRDQLAYFALSVFWRASVHTWPPISEGGDPVRIDLGKTINEALRRYLLGETGIPPNVSMLFIVCTDKMSQGSFQMPKRGKKEGFVWNYGFTACGYIFNLVVSKQVPKNMVGICFLHSPDRWIFMRDASEKIIEAFRDLIARQPPEKRTKRTEELRRKL